MLAFTCGEFLLHIPCWLYIYLGSFSYTSRSGFIFICRVSLTHPTLALIFCWEFLTHPSWLFFFFFLNILGSFSYTSRAGFIFMRGVSQTHPVLALFLSGEFLLHIPFLLYFSRGGWRGGAGALIQGSLSYTSHAGFFVFFNLGSFSSRSRAGFVFMRGVSLTHPVLALFFI